jgi:carbonic anhydrase
VYLDHDDQVSINHGAGNYITIGSQRFNLEQIHFHTPGEYTVNGAPPAPLEFHFVHLNADPRGFPKVAVVGVFVQTGKADPGLIELPSEHDPTTVDIDLNYLLPPIFQRDYWRFAGSLTTPTEVPFASTRCAEGLLWTVMKTPITMSPGQLSAFENSSVGFWGVDVTNRPIQPDNGRYILSPFGGGL